MFDRKKPVLALIACGLLAGAASAQHTVTLTLQGLGLHQGKLFKARMVEATTAKQVAETTVTAIPAASFSVVFAGESGKSYTLDFFVDVDGNGGYSAPPADHAWRRSAGPLHHQGLFVTFTHDLAFTDIKYPAGSTGLAHPGFAAAEPGNGSPGRGQSRSLLGRKLPPQKTRRNSSRRW